MGTVIPLRLLLDTHAFLWWLSGDESLSILAREAIENQQNDVLVSAASAWEISTKYRLGKLPGAAAIVTNIDTTIAQQSFSPLAVTVHHGQVAGSLPGPIRDPFDRMLIAQAMLDNLVIVSNEETFDAYGVTRLW